MTFAKKYGRPIVEAYKPMPHNVIMWRGRSQFTGEEIFAIATASNANRKIGEMVQIWIITATDPMKALQAGLDDATCGDCKLRGTNGKQRICYVEVWRAVRNIWQGSHNPKLTKRMDAFEFANHAKGLQLRIGAYGDPVSVPLAVWEPMLTKAGGWTAYTHAWRNPIAKPYQFFCMASVDTAEEQREAAAMGWRTFRTRFDDTDQRLADEIVCPYEQGLTVCGKCELCRGSSRTAKSIVVEAHGISARKWFPLVVHQRRL